VGVRQGDRFTPALFERLLEEEYDKLQKAHNKDVHDDSKGTTLPIARAIATAYVRSDVKAPWYIDLLNLTLGLEDLRPAEQRIARFLEDFAKDGIRVTENVDFQG
jgi:malate synthase